MFRRASAAGVLILVALVASCSQSEPAPSAKSATPEWVALVGSEPITVREFRRAFAPVKAQYRLVPVHEAPSAIKLKRLVLDRLIEERLVSQEVARAGIKVPEVAVDKAITLTSVGYDRDRFEELLLQTGQTRSQFRARLRQRMAMNALFRDKVFKGIKVTEAEAREHFRKNPGRYAMAEEVRARHLAVRTQLEAQQLRERIEKGASFAALARKHSLSPEGQKGGDFGWFRRGQKPKTFEDICFKLAPGKVSKVVTTDYGYHLFKVVAKRAARPRSFAEAREQILTDLKNQRRAQAEASFWKNVRERIVVRIAQQTLQRVK